MTCFDVLVLSVSSILQAMNDLLVQHQPQLQDGDLVPFGEENKGAFQGTYYGSWFVWVPPEHAPTAALCFLSFCWVSRNGFGGAVRAPTMCLPIGLR